MHYSTIQVHPDGSMTPMTTFLRVVPLNSTSVEDPGIPFHQLNISSSSVPSARLSEPAQRPSVQTRDHISVSTTAKTRSASPFATSKHATSSHPRRSTRFSTPTPAQASSSRVEPEGNIPKRFSRGIRGDTSNYTVWWETSGPFSRHSPPALDAVLEPGMIYIHRNTHQNNTQAWVWTTKERWREVGDTAEGGTIPHPVLRDRHFWLRPGGEPTWVIGSTLRTYLRDWNKTEQS